MAESRESSEAVHPAVNDQGDQGDGGTASGSSMHFGGGVTSRLTWTRSDSFPPSCIRILRFRVTLPNKRAAFIAAHWAPSSCTSPTRSAATGSSGVWRRRPNDQVLAPARVLDRLIRAELFEQVLQARYVGTKRYSLEGLAVLIPLLDAILERAAERGAEQMVLAMSHRGRLNVMVHIVGRPAAEIFADFEDVDPRSVLGSGDVKYHVGRHRTISHQQRTQRRSASGLESESSGSGRSGGDGPRPCQAGAHGRQGGRSAFCRRASRRCRLCGPGYLGGDAQSGRVCPPTPSAAQFTSSSTICWASRRRQRSCIPRASPPIWRSASPFPFFTSTEKIRAR